MTSFKIQENYGKDPCSITVYQETNKEVFPGVGKVFIQINTTETPTTIFLTVVVILNMLVSYANTLMKVEEYIT